jgi:hypothetical protein
MSRHRQGKAGDRLATQSVQSLGLLLGELPLLGGLDDAVERQRLLCVSGYPRSCTRPKAEAQPYMRRTSLHFAEVLRPMNAIFMVKLDRKIRCEGCKGTSQLRITMVMSHRR